MFDSSVEVTKLKTIIYLVVSLINGGSFRKEKLKIKHIQHAH